MDISEFNSRETGAFDVKVDTASDAMKESLCFQLSYYRYLDHPYTRGVDFAREIKTSIDLDLQHFEEVYTTSQWLVRIYKLKKEPSGFVWDGESRPRRS